MNATVYRDLKASKPKSSYGHALEHAFAQGYHQGYEACQSETDAEARDISDKFQDALIEMRDQIETEWHVKTAELRRVLQKFCAEFAALKLAAEAMSHAAEEDDKEQAISITVPRLYAKYFDHGCAVKIDTHAHDSILLKSPHTCLAWQIDQFSNDLMAVFDPYVKGENNE